MILLDHTADGATIHLNSKELVMLMALVQEGRDSFECDGQTGQALDELVSTAVMLVARAQFSRERKLPDSLVV